MPWKVGARVRRHKTGGSAESHSGPHILYNPGGGVQAFWGRQKRGREQAAPQQQQGLEQAVAEQHLREQVRRRARRDAQVRAAADRGRCQLDAESGPQRRWQLTGGVQPVHQDGLDCEPRQHTHTKKGCAPLRVAERAECNCTDKTSGYRWQIQHRRRRRGIAAPIGSWPVRSTPKINCPTQDAEIPPDPRLFRGADVLFNRAPFCAILCSFFRFGHGVGVSVLVLWFQSVRECSSGAVS
jgi:hypothetical protein